MTENYNLCKILYFSKHLHGDDPILLSKCPGSIWAGLLQTKIRRPGIMLLKISLFQGRAQGHTVQGGFESKSVDSWANALPL